MAGRVDWIAIRLNSFLPVSKSRGCAQIVHNAHYTLHFNTWLLIWLGFTLFFIFLQTNYFDKGFLIGCLASWLERVILF